MTNEEAINTIKTAIAEVEWNYPMDYAVAFEAAVSAIEKQIPKIVRKTKNEIVCPTCGTLVGSSPYCRYCGQKLSWE